MSETRYRYLSVPVVTYWTTHTAAHTAVLMTSPLMPVTHYGSITAGNAFAVWQVPFKYMEALFEMQCPRQYARQLPRASPRTFFAGLTAKRQKKLLFLVVIHVSPKLTITCMEDPSSELSSLFKYPNILKLYVKLNTGLPASAAVERLFSLGGRVFTPLVLVNMTSEHFGMLVFLRAFERGLYRPNHFDFYASSRGADVTQTILVFSIVCL
jgi:hypothetical protein